MTGKEYVELAMRTNDGNATGRIEKDLDREHLKKELGDVMWYMAMICYSFGFDLDEILQMNIDKLKARYPEGFDTERANHRAEGDI